MLKTIYHWAISAGVLCAGLLISQAALATCTTGNQYTGTGTLRAVNYSSGPDAAVGSTIYRQSNPGLVNVNYSCTGANVKLSLSLVGGTLVPGTTDTWQSGVSGIGIKIYQGANESGAQVTSTTPYQVSLPASSGAITPTTLTYFIAGVKIGTITAGQANATLLPQIHWNITDDSGGLTRIAYTNWAASGFTVNTPSCTTPDFTFDLGSALISNGAPTSSWVSTPVTLTGCSAFYGNSSDLLSVQVVAQGVLNNPGAGSQSGTFASNTVTMTLSPQLVPTDSAQGILANQSGGGFANGVGVQLATQSGSTYTPVNLATGTVFNPALGSSTVSFPLAARMIKTDDLVTPGKVTSSVTYTITYQ